MASHQDSVFALMAIVISVFSAVISALALGWNIYRDVILKPRLRIRFTLSKIIHPGFGSVTSLVLEATNHGPGQVKCDMMFLKIAPWWRRLRRSVKHAALIHDYSNPISGQLPAKLDIGEGINLLIRYQKEECFLSEGYTHIGLKDSFGRVHWAPSRDVAKARKQYRRDFGDGKTPVGKPDNSG